MAQMTQEQFDKLFNIVLETKNPALSALLAAALGQAPAAETPAVSEASPPVNQTPWATQPVVLIEPLVTPGTAGTVTLPRTGHTLALPQPTREGFLGYCQRVSRQVGGLGTDVGALVLGTDWVFARFGGFKPDGSNWPQAADYFFNRRAYMTPEELAKDDQAIAGMAEHNATVRRRAPASGGQGSALNTPPGDVPVDIANG